MQAHYDDPNFFYDKYWQSRLYEHRSEEIAISRLIGDRNYPVIADIGGGYGRLSHFLTQYAKKVYLIEPSKKQLEIGKKYLSGKLRQVSLLLGTAEKTKLPPHSVDLAIMVRVMHHLPDPTASFKEISRIVKPDQYLILEFANSYHLKSRILSLITGEPILPTPKERRSNENIKKNTIPFVNHHPQSVLRYLDKVGFTPINVLSVSNFRSPFLKKFVPLELLLKLERACQPLLSKVYFGPSIFILAKKRG